MSEPKRLSYRHGLALAGLTLLAFAVALYEHRVMLGPIPLDAVIITLPVALVTMLPLLRERGRGLVADTGLVLPSVAFLGFALVSCVADGFSVPTFMTLARYVSYGALMGGVAIIAREPIVLRVTTWAVALAGIGAVAYGAWWYLDTLAEVRSAAAAAGAGAPTIALRVASTFQNPNFFSEFLVLLLAVQAFLLVSERGLARVLVAVMSVATAAVLLLTYTRGSWLGLFAAGVLVTLAIAPRRAWLVVAAPLLVVMMSPTVQSRFALLLALEGSADFRLRLWRVAGAAILASPVFGSGIGTFYDAFTEVVTRDPSLAVGFAFYGAHNSYYTLFAETGVFGGVAFVALILAILRLAARPLLDAGLLLGSRLEIGALVTGLGAFALNAFTSNSFQHPQATVFFWLLAGVLAARVADAQATVDSGIRHPVTSTTGRTGLAARMAQGSVVLGVLGRLERRVAEVWVASRTREMLTRTPPSDGVILLSSRTLGFVLGERGPQDGSEASRR